MPPILWAEISNRNEGLRAIRHDFSDFDPDNSKFITYEFELTDGDLNGFWLNLFTGQYLIPPSGVDIYGVDNIRFDTRATPQAE